MRIILTILLLLISTGVAQAGLQICNKTEVTHSLAVAYKDGDIWKSEGWWNIDAAACKTVISGDLKQRYYYYRATAKGRQFNGERYFFCTQSSVFTINGDENCQARGFERAEFSKLDTGNTAKEFTLNLVPSKTGAVLDPLPRVGSLGEPITASGTLQRCDLAADPGYCLVISEGWEMYIYQSGGTPRQVLKQLNQTRRFASIDFEGDLVSFGDTTAELVIRKFSVINGAYDSYLALLQGEWRDSSDRSARLLFEGAKHASYYGDVFINAGSFRIANSCTGANGDGPALVMVDEGDPESYCYVIYSLDGQTLLMSYVGGTGQSLEYYKVR